MSAKVDRMAYSVAEICEAGGMSRTFFYRLCREGQGPATFKVRGRRFIRSDAARAWLQELERAGGEPKGGEGRKK